MPIKIFYPYLLGNNSPVSRYKKSIAVRLPKDEFNIRFFSQKRKSQIGYSNIAEEYVGDPTTLFHGKRRLRQYLRKYDIIHSGGRARQHARRLRLSTKIFREMNHVQTFHLDIEPESERTDILEAKRWLVENADRITAVSRSTRDTVIECFDVPCSVIYNGVNTSEFKPVCKKPNIYTSSSRPYFLFVGTFEQRKRPLDVLSVAELVPEVDFLLRGSGPMSDEVRTRASEINNVDLITEVIDKQELIRLYSGAIGFLFPTVREGCPTVVLEAMACETPIIGYTATSMPELVTDGKTGYLTEPGEVESLADHVRILANQKKLAARLGRNARKHVKNNHKYEDIAAEFKQIYNNIT